MMDELHRQYPMIDVKVHVVKNNFFGGNVGVAGLVTATDIIAQCEGKLESGTWASRCHAAGRKRYVPR